MAAQMGPEGFPSGELGKVRRVEEPLESPSLRGVGNSQLPTQVNDQLQPDDADSNQVGHMLLTYVLWCGK